MKSSAIKYLLRNLNEQRKATFFSILKLSAQGDLLVDISKFFLETNAIEEEPTRKRFDLTAKQYFHHLATIGDRLRQFYFTDSEAAQLSQFHDLARMFVTAGETEAATETLRLGIKAAAQVEDFDMIIRLRGIAALMRPAPMIEGPQLREAINAKANLAAFEDLKARFDEAKQIEDIKERNRIMEEILTHDLLSAPEKALSRRSTYLYWKLRSYWYYLNEHHHAIEYQKNLVAFIKDNGWVFPDEEAAHIKEICILGMLLRHTTQFAAYQELATEIELIDLKGEPAKQERIFFTYPFRIFQAIEDGNSVEVIGACTDFLKLLTTSTFEDQFVTENLYGCLYGAIAANSTDLTRKVYRLLREYKRADFKPPYFAMMKLLEIIMAIDEDLDEAKRLIKNLKRSSPLPKGMEEVLAFLSFLISVWEQSSGSSEYKLQEDAIATLSALGANSRLFDYFDLPAWFAAREQGCTMLDIFRHRASSNSNS